MIIRDIMKKAMVIEEDISLSRASEIMKSENISSLIFMKKGKIGGIITHEDLVENFGKKIKISKVMSKKVITINEEEKIDSAIDLIKSNKISVLPVVNSQGNLVGIVDDKDLLTQACETEDFLLD